MYVTVIADIKLKFSKVPHGACCVDDLNAEELEYDLSYTTLRTFVSRVTDGYSGTLSVRVCRDSVGGGPFGRMLSTDVRGRG